jgi:hypothetical protein
VTIYSTIYIDGARLATPRLIFTHHEHGEDDRRDGNQNAQFATGGLPS